MPTNPTTKGERWRFSVAYGGIVEMEAPSYAQLFDGFGETSERERRGRLAAASPEMFEALEAMVENAGESRCRICSRGGHDFPHADWCPVPKAEAALSKAKGEQSK